MNEIDIPAIRGVIGKLTYYTATFTFKQIAERVKRADEELHMLIPGDSRPPIPVIVGHLS